MKQDISITVDSVILRTSKNGEGQEVLLIQRKNDPFKDQWALPGGFLEEDEVLEDGAKRELEEETGFKVESLQQFGIFDAIKRDPRGRTISVAFYGLANASSEVKGNDDAREARWLNINNLPSLAFDHEEILNQAVENMVKRK